MNNPESDNPVPHELRKEDDEPHKESEGQAVDIPKSPENITRETKPKEPKHDYVEIEEGGKNYRRYDSGEVVPQDTIVGLKNPLGEDFDENYEHIKRLRLEQEGLTDEDYRRLPSDIQQKMEKDWIFQSGLNTGFQAAQQQLGQQLKGGARSQARGREIEESEEGRMIRIDPDKENEFRNGEYLRVIVDTQTGIEKAYYWYKDADKRVKQLREYLNKVEDTLASEGRQTQQLMMQELSLILPVLAGEPVGGRIEEFIDGQKIRLTDPESLKTDPEIRNKREKIKKHGELMTEEFIRRLHFHQFYVGYFEAGDTNTIAGVITKMYPQLIHFVMRDSNVAYTKNQIVDPKYPENKITETGATSRANLAVKRAFRWFEKNSFEFLRASDEGQELLRNQLIKDIAREMQIEISDEQIAKKDFESEYDNLRSAQVLAERFWEMSLRRHKHDVLINTKGHAIRSRDDAKKQAEAGELDFASKAKNGNFAARRATAIKSRLYTQAKNFGFQLDLIDDVDFWEKDVLSPLPGDLESHFRDQFTIFYGKAGITDARRQAWNDAKKITEAIIGIKKTGAMSLEGENTSDWTTGDWPETFDQDPEGKFYGDLNKYTDLNDMVWRIEDLDELAEPSDQDIRAGIKLTKEARREILQDFKDGKIDGKQVQEVKDELKDGFINYNFRIDSPAAKAQRHFNNVDQIRAEFEGKDDSLLSSPSEKKLVDTCQMLRYMAGARYINQILMSANFLKFREKNDLLHSAFMTDLEIAGIAANLNLNKNQMNQLREIAQGKMHLYKPLSVLLAYSGASGFFSEFLRELVKEILEEMAKGIGK